MAFCSLVETASALFAHCSGLFTLSPRPPFPFTKVVGGHGICSFHSLVHAALPIHFKFARTVRHGAAWLFARSLRLHLRFSLKRVILVWSMGLFHFWSP
jgi:hypothetical protein